MAGDRRWTRRGSETSLTFAIAEYGTWLLGSRRGQTISTYFHHSEGRLKVLAHPERPIAMAIFQSNNTFPFNPLQTMIVPTLIVRYYETNAVTRTRAITNGRTYPLKDNGHERRAMKYPGLIDKSHGNITITRDNWNGLIMSRMDTTLESLRESLIRGSKNRWRRVWRTVVETSQVMLGSRPALSGTIPIFPQDKEWPEPDRGSYRMLISIR